METSAVSEHPIKTGHYPLWDEVRFVDRDLTNTLVELMGLFT